MRLLVAVDLNDAAAEVLAMASTWAERLSATLDLLYVDEHTYSVYLVQDPAIRGVLDREWTRVLEYQEERLEELMNSLPEHLRGQTLRLAGRAWEEIVTAADERDAVILATHGRRGLSHVLMGSVAERVVRHARVPVLVVRLISKASPSG